LSAWKAKRRSSYHHRKVKLQLLLLDPGLLLLLLQLLLDPGLLLLLLQEDTGAGVLYHPKAMSTAFSRRIVWRGSCWAAVQAMPHPVD
jgi:hypothetical protein